MLTLISENTGKDVATYIDRVYRLEAHVHHKLSKKYTTPYIDGIISKVDLKDGTIDLNILKRARKLETTDHKYIKLLTKLKYILVGYYSNGYFNPKRRIKPDQLTCLNGRERSMLDVLRDRVKQPTIFAQNSKKNRNTVHPKRRGY